MKGYLFSHLSGQFSSMHRRSVSISIGKWSNVIYTFTLNRCFPTTANRTRLSIGLHTQTQRERENVCMHTRESWYRGRERKRESICSHTSVYIDGEEKGNEWTLIHFISFHFEATMKMFIVQKMFLVMVPLSTLFTSVAMLLPYWWSSETFQIGLWRARSIPTSSWILVEPQIETTEGSETERWRILHSTQHSFF